MNRKLALWLFNITVMCIAPAGWATESQEIESTKILGIRDRARPATSVKVWLSQVEATVVRVIGVKVDRVENELEITLTTADDKPLTVDASKFRAEGDRWIADIPNAVLALPEKEFRAENPADDIAAVKVVQQNANQIQVIVSGKGARPRTEVTLKAGGLAYSLNPDENTIDDEVVVTGAGQRGYWVPNSTTGSRTNTPIRDLPFSVQVVPQELLQDRRVESVNEALRTVAGVTPDNPSTSAFEGVTIRGFSTGFSGGNIFRNGLRDGTNVTNRIAIPNIEQIEVLKGPAGALFGQGSPGGTVNIVTKKPLAIPQYTIDATIGNFDTYAGSIDFTGPLNEAKTLLYRFVAGAYSSGTFIDFFDRRSFVVAPTLTWQVSPETKLTLEGEYTIAEQPNARGLPAKGTVLPNINGRLPRNRFIGEPEDELDKNDRYGLRLGYTFEHQISSNWQFRNAFRASFLRTPQNSLFPAALLDDERTLERGLFSTKDQSQDNYIIDTNVIGTFKTGSIAHKLLFGVDFNVDIYASSNRQFALAPIDIFNPVYRQPRGELLGEFPREPFTTTSIGIYLQDQIDLLPNLKLLLGGRFDFVGQKIDFVDGTESSQTDQAFSPRVGIVYQPSDWLSLYASYSRSFLQSVGTAFDNTLFKPERTTQYEAGIKAEFLNRRLSTTLAFYQITRSNVLTADLLNPNFSIQTGEQRSRGIEIDIAGEILPGWKIAAGYAYTNVEITADNTFAVGNRINNVPENAAGLWTTYEIQSGALKGFGMGLGLFYVGERQGDLDNSFQVPSYTRTDASLFYRRDNFRIGLNIENLFDVRYFETAESPLRVYYGAPFTIRGTISWTF